MIVVDVHVVVLDSVVLGQVDQLDLIDLVVQVMNVGFHCFKSDEHLRLLLHSLFVVVLVPNLLRVVEVINLRVEVRTRKHFAVGLAVRVLLMAWVIIVVFTVIVIHVPASLGLAFCLRSLSKGSNGGGDDLKFKHFIFYYS